MMAASGRGIRGKGGREEAGAGPPPESAGNDGDWEAGDPPLAGGGEPRGVGGGERRSRCEEAPRGGRGGGLAGRRKARGREPAWRACASPGKGEGEERPGGSSRSGGRGGSGGASCPRAPGRLAPGGRGENKKR